MEQTNQTELKEQEQTQEPQKLVTYSQIKEDLTKDLEQNLANKVIDIAMQRIQKTFLIDDRFALKQDTKQPEPQPEVKKEINVSEDYIKQLVKEVSKQIK